jgi:hypothetical protein
VDVDSVIKEAHTIARDFGLKLRIIDITDNIVNIKISLDTDLFIQVYANQLKDKLNMNLILKNRRLYGYDSEGGRTHCHPIENPESHRFTTKRIELREFVITALHFLEEQQLL